MPSFDVDDTIAAIASPPGHGMRGIIRISGPDCLVCLRRVFQFSKAGQCASKKSGTAGIPKSRRPFQTPVDIDLNADAGVPTRLGGQLLIWPSTQSYTRQPSAEFHTIGSPPLLNKVLVRICQSGARLAQPGEFTLRAFLSGRLDLPQAEAVLSIIDAQADQQLEVALRQLAGGLSDPLLRVREQLTWILAELEAGLDFAEEDLEFISQSEMINRLTEIENLLQGIAQQMKSREWSSQALRVALVGLPNAGKSAVFNELLGSSRAIVSNESGTTTDFLVGQLDLGGINVELTDTAGLEMVESSPESDSPTVQAQLQRERIESQAPIKLLCIDASIPLPQWAVQQIARMEKGDTGGPVTILVLTKADLVVGQAIPKCISTMLQAHLTRGHRLVVTQIPSPHQLSDLREAIRYQVLHLMEAQSEVVASTLVRTTSSLRLVIGRVQQALQCAKDRAGEELVAAEIRNALGELALITGKVYTDDILTLVFSRFCIGK